MTNSGKYSVIIFASETPTKTEIANVLLAASLEIGSVSIADMVSLDNTNLPSMMSVTITANAKDVMALKVVRGKSTRNKSIKGTAHKHGRSWKS